MAQYSLISTHNVLDHILECIRTKKIATAEEPAESPKIPPNDLKNFTTLVRYLGLNEEIVVSADKAHKVVPTEIVPSEKFNLHRPEITLQEEGKMAVHSPNEGHGHVLGDIFKIFTNKGLCS